LTAGIGVLLKFLRRDKRTDEPDHLAGKENSAIDRGFSDHSDHQLKMLNPLHSVFRFYCNCTAIMSRRGPSGVIFAVRV